MAKFASRYSELRIVLQPERVVRDENGAPVEVIRGRYIQFHGHRYDTDDSEEIEILRTMGPDVVEITDLSAGPAQRAPEIVRTSTTRSVEPQHITMRCDHCGKTFDSVTALASHIARKHTKREVEA